VGCGQGSAARKHPVKAFLLEPCMHHVSSPPKTKFLVLNSRAVQWKCQMIQLASKITNSLEIAHNCSRKSMCTLSCNNTPHGSNAYRSCFHYIDRGKKYSLRSSLADTTKDTNQKIFCGLPQKGLQIMHTLRADRFWFPT
jgi:hypothetical protein